MPKDNFTDQLTEARHLLNSQNFGAAADAFEKIVSEQKDFTATKLELLASLDKWWDELLKKQDEAQAKTVLERLKKLDIPKDYYKNIGKVYSNDPTAVDEAEAYFKKAIEMDDSYTLAHFELGNILSSKKSYDEATVQFQKVLESVPSDDRALYALERLYRTTGEMDKIIGIYEKAIEADPGNPFWYNTLGNIYADKNDLDAAIGQSEKAVAADVNFADAYGNLALIYHEKEDRQKEIEYYEKAIAAEPGNPGWYTDLGNVYADNEQYDEAIEQYNKAVAIDDQYVYAHANLGLVFKKKGAIDQSIESYEKAAAADPSNVDWYNELGYIYLDNKKDYDKALELYEKAFEQDPKNYRTLFGLQSVFKQKGQIEQAIEYYKKTIAADPANAAWHNDLGNIYADEKNYPEAIEQYTEALSINDKYANAYGNLGLIYKKKGETDTAIGYYQKAIDADPGDAGWHNDLGNLYFDKKDFDKAIEQFELAFQLEPKNFYTLINFRRAFKEKGEIEKVVSYYEKVIASDPVNPAWYNDLANVYFDKKEYDKAIELYKKAVEIKSDYANALGNLGLAFSKTGDIDKAISYYEKAIAAAPNDATRYNELGNTYFNEKKDYDKAIELYSKAIEIDKNYAVAYGNLGLAFAAKGDVDKAIEYYGKAIAGDPANPDWHNNLGIIYSDNKREYKKAIAEYKKAIDINENYIPAYSNIASAYINQKDYIKALEYCDMALKIDEKDFYARLNAALAYRLFEKKDLAEQQYKKLLELYPDDSDAHTQTALFYQRNYTFDLAEAEFKKAIAIQNKNYSTDHNGAKELSKAYFNLGNLYVDKLNYEQALEQFNDALTADPNNTFAIYNKGFIYEKLGSYRQAEVNWVAVNNLYPKTIDKVPAAELPDQYFYWAVVLNDYISDIGGEDFKTIESHIKKAISLDPNYTYYRLYLLKFYFKWKMVLEYEKENKTKQDIRDGLQTTINEIYIKLLQEYRSGVELLQKRLAAQKTKLDQADLGEFYLTMGQYKEAAHEFEDAINLDKDFTRAHIDLGVAMAKLEDNAAAIKCFRKALLLDPYDLDVQSNLADAYLKTENLPLAEETYKKILRITSGHKDALIGLGEYYKITADKLLVEANQKDAELYFKLAIETYNKVIEKGKPSSKKLDFELSGLYYSMGYIKVKLFELKSGFSLKWWQEGFGVSFLQSAKQDFERIKPNQTNYYKAQTAIEKIKTQSKPLFQKTPNYAAFAIVFPSFLVFLAMQFYFFVGRPTYDTVLDLNRPAFKEFIQQHKLDSVADKLSKIVIKKYDTEKDVEEKLQKAAPMDDLMLDDLEKAVLVKKSVFLQFKPIDATTYGTITFSCLIFIVIGMYLSNISKLKVGTIELEKTTTDTISPSKSLNISK